MRKDCIRLPPQEVSHTDFFFVIALRESLVIHCVWVAGQSWRLTVGNPPEFEQMCGNCAVLLNCES